MLHQYLLNLIDLLVFVSDFDQRNSMIMNILTF